MYFSKVHCSNELESWIGILLEQIKDLDNSYSDLKERLEEIEEALKVDELSDECASLLNDAADYLRELLKA